MPASIAVAKGEARGSPRETLVPIFLTKLEAEGSPTLLMKQEAFSESTECESPDWTPPEHHSLVELLPYHKRERLYRAGGVKFMVVKTVESQQPGDLWLQAGMTIEVLYIGKDGYWEGKVDGNRGWFPSTAVKELPKETRSDDSDVTSISDCDGYSEAEEKKHEKWGGELAILSQRPRGKKKRFHLVKTVVKRFSMRKSEEGTLCDSENNEGDAVTVPADEVYTEPSSVPPNISSARKGTSLDSTPDKLAACYHPLVHETREVHEYAVATFQPKHDQATEMAGDAESTHLDVDAEHASNKKYLGFLRLPEILTLLEKMGLKQYKALFVQEHIDGSLLVECDNQVLQKDLGITSKLHRIKLMSLISGQTSAQKILRERM